MMDKTSERESGSDRESDKEGGMEKENERERERERQKGERPVLGGSGGVIKKHQRFQSPLVRASPTLRSADGEREEKFSLDGTREERGLERIKEDEEEEPVPPGTPLL